MTEEKMTAKWKMTEEKMTEEKMTAKWNCDTITVLINGKEFTCKSVELTSALIPYNETIGGTMIQKYKHKLELRIETNDH